MNKRRRFKAKRRRAATVRITGHLVDPARMEVVIEGLGAKGPVRFASVTGRRAVGQAQRRMEMAGFYRREGFSWVAR